MGDNRENRGKIGGVVVGSKKPKITHRTSYGEGEFAWVDSKQVWRGRLPVPSRNGTQHRIEVTSKNEDVAWVKFIELKRKYGGKRRDAYWRDQITVGEWVAQWLERRVHTARPNTFTSEKSCLNTWVLPYFSGIKLSAITGDDIRMIATLQKNAGRSTTNAAYAQRVFQQVLKEARADGYTVDDTALLAKRVKNAVSDRTAIPTDEAVMLLAYAQRDILASRWVAALLQGMRQTECLGLTWDCVNFDAQTIDVSWQLQEIPYVDKERGTFRIPDGVQYHHLYGAYHLIPPKTHAGQRIIPMVPWMQSALAAWREVAPENPWGLVWANADGSVRTSRQDLRAWKKLQDGAGVHKGVKADGAAVYYVLHEARNTSATLLLAAGVDPEIIKQILGHADIVMSMKYTRVNTEMMRVALERVAHTLRLEP